MVVNKQQNKSEHKKRSIIQKKQQTLVSSSLPQTLKQPNMLKSSVEQARSQSNIEKLLDDNFKLLNSKIDSNNKTVSEVKSELIEQRNLIQKVTERVRKIEPTSASHSSGGFIEVTQEMIDQAKRYSINLNVDLAYNHIDLSSVEYNPSFINRYGRKLLETIFTFQELAAGSVEPLTTKCKYDPLDSVRINLIKAACIRRIGSVASFIEQWPFIRQSLRQKTHEARIKIKRNQCLKLTHGGWDNNDEKTRLKRLEWYFACLDGNENKEGDEGVEEVADEKERNRVKKKELDGDVDEKEDGDDDEKEDGDDDEKEDGDAGEHQIEHDQENDDDSNLHLSKDEKSKKISKTFSALSIDALDEFFN